MRPTLLRHYQRQTLRRAVRVECQLVREHDFKLVGDLALDLSTKGMLVRARTRVLTGEELLVAFRPPRSNRWIDAQGTIARVIHGRRPYDPGCFLGVKFDVFDDQQARLLRADLQGLPPPFPKRELRIDYAASIRQFMLH